MQECTNTLALSDEDLMSLVYAEDNLPPQEQAHFETCPLCQQRLAMYASLHTVLRMKLFRRLCPSAVRLNYYCLAMVPEEERMSIASHLLECPHCADEVARFVACRSPLSHFLWQCSRW